MDYQIPQKKQTLVPSQYSVRICVNGSRKWTDKKKFHKELTTYLERFPEGTEILFISGKESTGAGDFIIRWCQKFGFPCKEVAADWEADGNGASFLRNEKMSSYPTHLLSFWDGASRGTKHMIDICVDRGIPVKIIQIAIPK